MISKSVGIPISTAGSIVRKWKLHHTIQALPRQGRLSKLSRLVRESMVRPTVTLKELQSTVAERGGKVF